MQAIKEKVSERKTVGRESLLASHADVLRCLSRVRNALRTPENVLLPFDQFRFLRNCPPTPPLSHHFALSEN